MVGEGRRLIIGKREGSNCAFRARLMGWLLAGGCRRVAVYLPYLYFVHTEVGASTGTVVTRTRRMACHMTMMSQQSSLELLT